ncbi:hypothetical protein PsYK624_123440 [Phanerochaete sordida]|uniref:Uncharacterized protein n=1 Tax=Phanerochaete sordida TaxID=48140 RepID=A0A9P3GJX9_9APHY|nr:hypothetical protein PsYK624_123440 [Phanerochaete sordida]
MHTSKAAISVLLCWILAPAFAWPIFPWGSPTPIPDVVHATAPSPTPDVAIPGSLAATPSTHESTPEDDTSYSSTPFVVQPPFRLDDTQQALHMPPRRDSWRSPAGRSHKEDSREARLVALMGPELSVTLRRDVVRSSRLTASLWAGLISGKDALTSTAC